MSGIGLLCSGRPPADCLIRLKVLLISWYLESIQGSIIFYSKVFSISNREKISILAQQTCKMQGFCTVFDVQFVNDPFYHIITCKRKGNW